MSGGCSPPPPLHEHGPAAPQKTRAPFHKDS